MAESYSVIARLSAKDTNFTSTMKGAGRATEAIEKRARGGLGFGIMAGIGQSAFSAIVNGAKGMVGEIDANSKALQTFDGNMKILGKSDKYIKNVSDELADYASATIYNTSDMANTYAQLAAVGTKNTTKLVEGFGGLAAASENPKQAMKTLSQQATQMAGRPTVAWQDFKLMLEQSPAGISAVAKEMGMTTSELVGKVQDGTLATKDFFKAVTKVGNSDGFSKMAKHYKTVGEAVDGLKENLAYKLSPAFKVVSDKAITGVEKIIDAVDKLNGESVAKLLNGGLATAAPKIMSKFFEGLQTQIPLMLAKGATIISKLGEGISAALPTLIPKAAETIATLIQSLINNLPKLLTTGLKIIEALGTGIINSLPTLAAKAPRIVFTITRNIIKFLPKLLETGVRLIGKLAAGIVKAIPKVISSTGRVLTSILSKINPFNLTPSGARIIRTLGSGISSMIGFIGSKVRAVTTAIKNGFTSFISNCKNIGINIMKGIGQGIANGASWLKSALINSVTGALGKLADFLGIQSPSRYMAKEFGRYMALGVGVGFEDYIPEKSLKTTVSKMVDDLSDRLSTVPMMFNGLQPAMAGFSGELSADYSYDRKIETIIEVPVTLDGKEIARTSAKYIGPEIKKNEARDSRKRGII